VRGDEMDVKEAVAIAKQCINEIFSGEQIADFGLEEVEFDDESGIWLVTFGFSRPWDVRVQNPIAATFGPGINKKRDYKLVRISDSDKKLISIKNREPSN
jgi:hypothetical protein